MICDPYNRQVLQTALAWRRAGHRVWLCHVLQTWGSAPRHPGAMLALREDGWLEGSVSGGCIEDDLIQRVQSGQLPAQISDLHYGVDRADALRWGLPCGGSLRLLVEPLLDENWLVTALDFLSRQQRVVRRLDLASAQTELIPVTTPALAAQISADQQSYQVTLGPDWRLLIIGAAQLARLLVPLAQSCGFSVYLCDPRSEYQAAWQDSSCQWILQMPDDAVEEFAPDNQSAIVCLAHDPKLDDMALLTALKSPAFYVGALGSLKNSAARRQRLGLFDLSETEISRLHAPIGINLHSKIPAEIAIAIMAEIIQKKNALHTGESITIETQVESACSLS